jgi:long-chain acyl-CoA synthetase
MKNSIAELLSSSACKFGEKVALIMGEEEWTFAQINEASSAIARSLARRGIGAGSVVSIFSPNCHEWIIAYYGILKTGAAVNPLNMMLTASEASYAIRDCGSRAVFGTYEKLAELRSNFRCKDLSLIAFDRSDESIEPFSGFVVPDELPPCPVVQIRPEDRSTICYTSGTTGQPKGVVLSHRAILMNTAMTSVFHVRTSADAVVSALPCSHVYGNIVMNSAIACGMTLVLHSTFDADAILYSIQRHRATLFEGVPTMYMYLLDSPCLAQYDLSSLTRCTVGGQTMPVSKMLQVEETFGVPLIELWGMTELGGLGTTHPLYGPRKHGSIGVPLPFLQAEIFDTATGATVPTGSAGELRIKGPVVMNGYHNREEETAETIDNEGWLRTGDVAYRDEDGFVYIVDRLKDMIITGGYNIYPAELERVLCQHPDVSMAAVVGIPDETKGELAKAFIVPKAGTLPSEDVILQFCRDHLAAYKIPRQLEFLDDLPKTASGKILRRSLKPVRATDSQEIELSGPGRATKVELPPTN